MSAIIMAQNGMLVAVRAKEATPGLLSIEGLTAGTAGVLITSFSQSDNVAHQVTQTIGGPEYIFVFGDMLQDLSIGIVMYPKGCAGSVDSALAAWKFYSDKRLRPGSVQIVNLTFAGLTLRGLVVGLRTDADASTGTQVIRGTLILKGWAVTETSPSSRRGGSGSSAAPASGGTAPSPGPISHGTGGRAPPSGGFGGSAQPAPAGPVQA
jgi:hypothetical protein